MRGVALLMAMFSCAFATLHAEPLASAAYKVPTDSLDAGGARSVSTTYSHSGSVGGIAGVAQAVAPSQTAKQGYIAQLYAPAGIALTSASPTVNESGTVLISAQSTQDDASQLSLDASLVGWFVISGPLASVGATGLATAGVVYQNTGAMVGGSYAGFSGSVAFTVVNLTADDFGAYAGDGLPDEWQVLYFGEGNALAAPLLDPDGDGHSNLFEYKAGLLPNSALSRFFLEVQAVTGQPTQMRIVFNPRYTSSTYTVENSTDLQSWSTLTGATTSDSGDQRTVTDLSATEGGKFYRVRITKP